MTDNMLTNFVDKLISLSDLDVTQVALQTYAQRQPYLITTPQPASLKTHTLQSVIDFIQYHNEIGFVFIESPVKVSFRSFLDKDNQRLEFIQAIATPCGFNFGQWSSVEKFIIDAQACFKNSQDRAEILKHVGNLVAENIKTATDDGISQNTVVQKTSASRASAVVPNPVILQPYRTFREVEQPESQFVFRLKFDEKQGEFYCGLWPADGDAWELEAIVNIKQWLQMKLDGLGETGMEVSLLA